MNRNIFKPHIAAGEPYRGGSTRAEVNGTTKLFKLSSNENPLGASPKAMQAIRENLAMIHEYNYQDDGRFREKLADHYCNQFTTEQFLVTNSALELVETIVRGFLDPGLECILSTPTFLAYKNFAELQGATVIDVPLNPQNFSLNARAILDAVNERTRILFLASPNNPTGSIIPGKTMDEILRNLPEEVIVVYDEVYRHFSRDPDYVCAAEYVEQGKNIIGLNSFSKIYGLAGLRIGYAYSTLEIATYLRKLKRPFMVNTITSEAAMAALGDTSHVLATQKLVRQEKKWMMEQLEKLGVFTWPSEANFILFRSPYDATRFAADLLHAGVMIRTTEPFGLPGCIRLSIGTREANQACLHAMEKGFATAR